MHQFSNIDYGQHDRYEEITTQLKNLNVSRFSVHDQYSSFIYMCQLEVIGTYGPNAGML